MQKARYIVMGAILVLFGSLALGKLAFAQSIRSGNTTTVASGEVIDGSAYLAGRTIDVAGEIKGDLYCAGQTINITGIVHGDVLCAGQTIQVLGTVDGNVRTAGQDVVVSAKINKNVTAAGQNLILTASSEVGGDVTGGSASAALNGKIGRDVVFGASDLVISGQIARNVKTNVQTLTLNNSARIGGSIDYTSKNELKSAGEAKIAGTTTRTEPKQTKAKTSGTNFAGKIYWFVASIFGAFMLVLLFPSVYAEAYEHTRATPWKTALYGLLSFITVPALFVALLFTVVGIPLAFMLLFVWAVILMLSSSFMAFYIGKQVATKQRNPLLVMLIGAVILYFLQLIPVVGVIVGAVAVVTGTGIFLREAMRRTPRPKYQM